MGNYTPNPSICHPYPFPIKKKNMFPVSLSSLKEDGLCKVIVNADHILGTSDFSRHHI